MKTPLDNFFFWSTILLKKTPTQVLSRKYFEIFNNRTAASMARQNEYS